MVYGGVLILEEGRRICFAVVLVTSVGEVLHISTIG